MPDTRSRTRLASTLLVLLAWAGVLPCVEAAVSAPQLQRDCLIPLDDEGAVEGRHFGRNKGVFSNE